MLRSSLFTVSALALVASASAQTRQNPGAATATRINQPVKFAGTYHVATRTFTRGQAAVATFGTSDAMYAANTDTPYFAAIETGEQFQDSGNIPGSTNTLVSGGRDENFVTSFDFAYCECDPTLSTTSFEIDFYESGIPCNPLLGAVPAGSFLSVLVKRSPFTPDELDRLAAFERLDHLKGTLSGGSKNVRRIATAEHRGIPVQMLMHTYTTSNGKSSSTITHTVVTTQCPPA